LQKEINPDDYEPAVRKLLPNEIKGMVFGINDAFLERHTHFLQLGIVSPELPLTGRGSLKQSRRDRDDLQNIVFQNAIKSGIGKPA
jgi:hypothetical protein